jgi:hypothetical protein
VDLRGGRSVAGNNLIMSFVIRQRIVKLAGYVAGMAVMKKLFNILVARTEEKDHLVGIDAF